MTYTYKYIKLTPQCIPAFFLIFQCR